MPGEEDEEGYEFGFVILTRRLILRAPRPEDDAAMAALAANPFVAENLAASPRPLAGKSGECFAVLDREKRLTVGAVAYGPMVDRRASVEVAAWIGAPFWGSGFATEATQAVIDRAFTDNRVNLLWCSNRASNHRARRVIEKCGFQFRETGMVRSPSLRGAMPVERFVLERRNWRSIKAWGANQDSRDNSMRLMTTPHRLRLKTVRLGPQRVDQAGRFRVFGVFRPGFRRGIRGGFDGRHSLARGHEVAHIDTVLARSRFKEAPK